MATVTVDLPADLLEEVNRLAREHNVPRADVYREAVATYARALDQARELGTARETLAAMDRERARTDREVRDRRAFVIGLSGTVESISRERDVAVQRSRETTLRCQALAREIASVRAAIREAEARQLQAERTAAQLEERDRQKVLAVMRDRQVESLRKNLQELGVTMQKLESELAYQRMDLGQKAGRLATLTRQLATALGQKKQFETGFLRQQKETFRIERQVGKLLQERARLRDELKRLAGLFGKLPGTTPARTRKVQSSP